MEAGLEESVGHDDVALVGDVADVVGQVQQLPAPAPIAPLANEMGDGRRLAHLPGVGSWMTSSIVKLTKWKRLYCL